MKEKVTRIEKERKGTIRVSGEAGHEGKWKKKERKNIVVRIESKE